MWETRSAATGEAARRHCRCLSRQVEGGQDEVSTPDLKSQGVRPLAALSAPAGQPDGFTRHGERDL